MVERGKLLRDKPLETCKSKEKFTAEVIMSMENLCYEIPSKFIRQAME